MEIPFPNSVEPNLGTKRNSLTFSGRNASSSSSVKEKKSPNIFSSLVKIARRRKSSNKNAGDEAIKNSHISLQNSSCDSTTSLGVHLEEGEISRVSYENKGNQGTDWEGRGAGSEVNIFNQSTATLFSSKSPKKSLAFLQYCNLNFTDNLAQTTEHQNRQLSDDKDAAKPRLGEEHVKNDDNIVLSSFIPFENPFINATLADGIQYIQETVSSLHDSENHIASLIGKYITDADVQKQLLAAITHHSQLQWNAERRSTSLANDMWIQQLEIGRAQEKILQDTLNSFVKQNRHLQIENECLYRKHEKAVKTLRSTENRPKCPESETQVDCVIRHNEKLQVKLETLFKKSESLEAELLIFQKQNDSMEQQLRHCTVAMQNMKATIHKMKTDHELERTALNFKLNAKEQMLQESMDAGDILVDDLDGLKRQLKHLPFSFNWSKFKVRGNCLADVIHICRSSINDLSKEILTMHNEITSKDKDISTLRETNAKLQETVEKSSTEMEIMSKKIEENFTATTCKLINEQKIQILEHELKNLEGKTEELKNQIGIEKSLRMESIADFEYYKKEVQEKDKMIEQTNIFVANVTAENCSLKHDVAVLNQLLKETGAGDVTRQIDQHEMEKIHRELRQCQQENRCLITDLGTAKNENAVILAKQEAIHKNLQKQIQDVEKVNDEIQSLRQKFDTEHQTVLYLQSERKKYLEEKNILKSIIQHMKNELAKMKTMEHNLTNVTKEASKLGLVAEYNKQQGEKLKKEVTERESIIAQLKSSVQKLNELNLQNSKEKLSLCYELNEVCQIKEKLNEVLTTEVQKNVELGQSNEAIVKSVNSQIQKIEEKQRNERTAIRILLKDIKIIAEEKEALSTEKNILHLELENLNSKLAEQGKRCEKLTKEIAKKEQENADLKKDRIHCEEKQKEFHERVKTEETKYDTFVKQLKKLIDQLRNEKNVLYNSNECVKKDVEKLQKDLDMSRKNEKDLTDLINKTKEQLEESQNLLIEQTQLVNNLTKDKEKLEDEKTKLDTESNYLNTIMDKVVNDFEKSITTSEEKERIFKCEFDEAKKLLMQYAQEIQDLNNTVDLKEKKIDELNNLAKDEQFNLKQYLKLKGHMEDLEKEDTKIKEENSNLEALLQELQSEYKTNGEKLHKIEKELYIKEKQLKMILVQKEEDYVFYKKHIAELLRARDGIVEQNQNEMDSLRQEMEELQHKITNEKAAYETLSEIHKEISGKFMKSIKDLVNVKNARQELAEKQKEKLAKIHELEGDKNELNLQINKLVEELDTSKHLVIQLNEENNLLQKSYNKALDKCVSLEYEIKRIELDHHQDVKEACNKNDQNNDLQQAMENSKKELEATAGIVHKLKMEIARYKQEITLLQIEKSEITLECHETKKKLETEKNLSEQLKNTHKLLLAAVLQLKDEGRVDPSDCIHLLHMMDFLSSSQLRSYENIIDKIQSEHEKSEKLQQELDKENNKLIIINLAKSTFPERIAHLNVKIFSDVIDLIHLYRDELNCDVSSLFKKENCKFYLVEAFLTNALYRKLKDLNWFLVISVKYGNVCVSKTTQGKNLVMPILEVLPVDANVVDCRVSATLILPTEDSWFNINLGTVAINISYHFEINKKSKFIGKHKKILELAKQYNENFDFLEIRKPLFIEYQFLTTIKSREFVKKFIQNCYHKVDLEYFSELGNDSKNNFVLKFSTGSDKHSISFDRSSHLLTLRSSFQNLVHLKNYFCIEGFMRLGDADKSDKFKKDIKKLLASAHTCEEKEDLCSFYAELRRLWTKSYT